MCFKRELRLATLCHGKRPPPSSIDYVRTTQLCPRKRPFSTANQRFSSTSGEKSGLVAGCGPLGVIAVARADGNLSAPPWGNGLHLYAAEPAIAAGVGRVIRQGVLIADVVGDLSTDGFGVLCPLRKEG